MIRIIALALLTFIFWTTACAQSAQTIETRAKSDQESNTTPATDTEKVREFADSLTKAIIEDRYEDIYSRMDQPFRDTVAEKNLKQILEKLYSPYGKLLEVEYKMTDSGFELLNGQKRPAYKNWYAVKTSKAEKGIYFLFITVVPNRNSLACSSFSIVSFPQGIPPQLK